MKRYPLTSLTVAVLLGVGALGCWVQWCASHDYSPLLAVAPFVAVMLGCSLYIDRSESKR